MAVVKYINPTIFPRITTEELEHADIYFDKIKIHSCPFCKHPRASLPRTVNELLRKKWTPNAIVDFILNGSYGSNYIPTDKRFFYPSEKWKNLEKFLEYGLLYHIAYCRNESYEKYAIKNYDKYLEVKNIALGVTNTNKSAKNKTELKRGMSVSVPAIIHNQLLIIQQDQERYLRGELEKAPDISGLTKILGQLEKLIGSHELSDIINAD